MRPPLCYRQDMYKRGADMANFDYLYSEIERKKKINKTIKKLEQIFSVLPEDRKAVADLMLPDVAFMATTLCEARETLVRDGFIDTYQNGANQFGTKKSAAFEVYDKMLNSYKKVVDQLYSMLPEAPDSDPAEEITKFVAGL